jgi:hypothetical protein
MCPKFFAGHLTIEVYPTPTAGTITIRSSLKNIEFVIVDLTGREVMKVFVSDNEFVLNGLTTP